MPSWNISASCFTAVHIKTEPGASSGISAGPAILYELRVIAASTIPHAASNQAIITAEK